MKWNSFRFRRRSAEKLQLLRRSAGVCRLADWTGSHVSFYAKGKCDRPQLPVDIGKHDSKRHSLPCYQSREARGMDDSTINRICIDIVGAGDFESAIGIGTNRGSCVTECASDVHMRDCVASDETSVFATPRAIDLRNGVRGSGVTRQKGGEGQDDRRPRRALTLGDVPETLNLIGLGVVSSVQLRLATRAF